MNTLRQDNSFVLAYTSHEVTTSALRENRNPWFNHDMIHRTVADVSTRGFSIQSWDTSAINIQISHWCADQTRNVEVLATVIKSQNKQLEYQSYYNAYLLGSLSEEEFEIESDAFICNQITMEPVHVADVISRLDQLLDLKFEDSQLAEFFHIDIAAVSEGRSLVHKPLVKSSTIFPALSHLKEITR